MPWCAITRSPPFPPGTRRRSRLPGRRQDHDTRKGPGLEPGALGTDDESVGLGTRQESELACPGPLLRYSAFGQAKSLQTSCAFSGETVSKGRTSQSGGLTWSTRMVVGPLDGLLAAGGIDEGDAEATVEDGHDAAVGGRQGVDADEEDLGGVDAGVLRGDVGTLGHGVVVPVEDVHVGMRLEGGGGGRDGLLAQPVGVLREDDVGVGEAAVGQAGAEAVTAVLGGRSALETADLGDLAGVAAVVGAPLGGVLAGGRRRWPRCRRR